MAVTSLTLIAMAMELWIVLMFALMIDSNLHHQEFAAVLYQRRIQIVIQRLTVETNVQKTNSRLHQEFADAEYLTLILTATTYLIASTNAPTMFTSTSTVYVDVTFQTQPIWVKWVATVQI